MITLPRLLDQHRETGVCLAESSQKQEVQKLYISVWGWLKPNKISFSILSDSSLIVTEQTPGLHSTPDLCSLQICILLLIALQNTSDSEDHGQLSSFLFEPFKHKHSSPSTYASMLFHKLIVARHSWLINADTFPRR